MASCVANVLCIAEHKYSAVGKHLKDEHQAKILDLDKYFSILRKCQGKLDLYKQ